MEKRPDDVRRSWLARTTLAHIDEAPMRGVCADTRSLSANRTACRMWAPADQVVAAGISAPGPDRLSRRAPAASACLHEQARPGRRRAGRFARCARVGFSTARSADL